MLLVEGDHQNGDNPKGGGKNMALELNDKGCPPAANNGASNTHTGILELRGLECQETRPQSSEARKVP